MKDFSIKFKINELLIFKTRNWNISLRPTQPTIGSLVLSLNRVCAELGQLKPEETEDLSDVFRIIEKMLQKSFQPVKINYLALMMVDHQVHFHVLPRYENKIIFFEKTFVDYDFPKPPNVLNTIELCEEELLQLKKYLIQNLVK